MKATENFCIFAERQVVRDTVKSKLNSLVDWIYTWVLFHLAKFKRANLRLIEVFCTWKKQICKMKERGKYSIFEDVGVCKRYWEKQNLLEFNGLQTYSGHWDFVASTSLIKAFEKKVSYVKLKIFQEKTNWRNMAMSAKMRKNEQGLESSCFHQDFLFQYKISRISRKMDSWNFNFKIFFV